MNSFSRKTSRIAYLRYFADLEAGGITRDSLGLINDLEHAQKKSNTLAIDYVIPENLRFLKLKRKLNLPTHFKSFNSDFVWLEQILPVKLNKGIRPIVRVHDIFPITNPRWFRFWTVIGFHKNLKILLDMDPILVFNSRASLSTFVNKFPLKQYSKFVIWCKPNTVVNEKCGVCEGCCVLRSGTIFEKFCLLVGTIEPRKNYRLVIDILGSNCPSDLKFVLIGRYGWKQSLIFRKLRSIDSSNLMLINNVCDGARLEITKNASVFMSASHDEGFGMPAAEARSLGVRLVLADIPVYREIHGQDFDVTYVGLQTPPDNWIQALEQSLLLSSGDEMWLKKFEETRLEQLLFFVNALNSMHLETK